MKILWCDDEASDPKSEREFQREWELHEHPEDLFVATDGDQALEALRDHPDIGLLVMDLLWEGQPEHATTSPLGLTFLRDIRDEFPDLRVVTRSQALTAAALGAWMNSMVTLGVFDHFAAWDKTAEGKIRRRMLLDRLRHGGVTQAELGEVVHEAPRPLAEAGYEEWGAVLFADVTGFTNVTERLWYMARDALCEALHEFYQSSSRAVIEGGGVIDKFIGDEVMALFLAESTEDKQAQQEAVERCLDCAQRLSNEFREHERRFLGAVTDLPEAVPSLTWSLKVGVEAGVLRILQETVGDGQREPCVLGGAVNAAARVKGLAAPYEIVLGPTAHSRLVKSYSTEPIEHEALKGLGPDFRAHRLVVGT